MSGSLVVGGLTAAQNTLLLNLSGGPVALASLQFSPATSVESGNDSTGTTTTWRQLIAATANAVKFIELCGNTTNADTSTTTQIQIGTGAAASEVIRGEAKVNLYSTATLAVPGMVEFYLFVPIDLPAGTRVAWRPIFTGTRNTDVGYTVGERA